MAGFLDKPFGLARNQVKPLIELQREVFPWIESAYGPDNSAWKNDCLKEMNELDEKEEEEEEVDNEKKKEKEKEELEIIEETALELSTGEYGKGKAKGKKKEQEKNQCTLQQDRDTARRGFLKLLVRCRRIILQYAAVHLYKGRKNNLLKDRVFRLPMFLEFQKEAVVALKNPELDQLHAYEQLVPTLVDVSKGVATKLSEVSRKQGRSQQLDKQMLDVLQQQTKSIQRQEVTIQNLVHQNQDLVQQNRQIIFHLSQMSKAMYCAIPSSIAWSTQGYGQGINNLTGPQSQGPVVEMQTQPPSFTPFPIPPITSTPIAPGASNTQNISQATRNLLSAIITLKILHIHREYPDPNLQSNEQISAIHHAIYQMKDPQIKTLKLRFGSEK
ncbi:hypothetical protein BGZ76_002704 [Entomortierella beljakovae]|nr:hypothetical protein BGZ76_002704 [Entomortierella beljakovae]